MLGWDSVKILPSFNHGSAMKLSQCHKRRVMASVEGAACEPPPAAGAVAAVQPAKKAPIDVAAEKCKNVRRLILLSLIVILLQSVRALIDVRVYVCTEMLLHKGE